MDQFTLRQLRYVLALARTQHFGQAAEACAVTQPALSVQIRQLEQTLGAALFERTTRDVRLTALGEIFVERAGHVMRAVDSLQDVTRGARGMLSGRLRLGVLPTIAPYLLPRLLRDMGEVFDPLGIEMRERITPRLIEDVLDRRLDAAIVALPVSEPDLTEFAVFEEKLLFVRPKAEANRAVPALGDLASMRLLLLEEGHCFRDQALSLCGVNSTRDAVPGHGLEGTSLATLVQMVGAGLGVTLIPEMAARVETRAAGVDVVTFEDPVPTRRIGMIWRDGSPFATDLRQVAEAVGVAAEVVLGRRLIPLTGAQRFSL
ncbi:MAG: LysR substrate-binding domain-containing protein [Pseudomonadota bacterium]